MGNYYIYLIVYIITVIPMITYDGFDSHLTSPVIDYCLEHKIIPFCLPAHTSHETQPLHKGVFPPLSKK